jgi:hypothetical protein
VLDTHGRNGQDHPQRHVLATRGGYDAPGERWEHLQDWPYDLRRRPWQWPRLPRRRQTRAPEAVQQVGDACFTKYPHGLGTDVHKGAVPSQSQSGARSVAQDVGSPPISVRRIERYEGEWGT